MARTFDGSGDFVHTTPGALSAMTFGTLAVVVRRNSTAYNNLLTLHTSGGVSRLGLEIESNGDGNNLQWQYDSSFVSSSFTVTNADGWVLLAMGKATGTSTPRCHKFVYSTGVWTHQDAGGTATNSTAVGGTGTMRFGQWEGGDDLAGDLAIAAAWSGRNLADVEVEQLVHSLQGWYAADPSALWLFDQQATSQALADLTGGGANQSSIGGTSVAAASAPIGYGFEIQVPHSVPAAGGGPIVVAVGQAVETDAATAVARAKARSVGQATEADTATAVARLKLRAVGTAVEADTATTVGRMKNRTVGQASETDTATAVARRKTLGVGQAVEVDTAHPVTVPGTIIVPVGQAVETDTAHLVGRLKTRTVGQAAEADTALPVGRLKLRAVGLAVEVDTAAAVTAAGGAPQTPLEPDVTVDLAPLERVVDVAVPVVGVDLTVPVRTVAL